MNRFLCLSLSHMQRNLLSFTEKVSFAKHYGGCSLKKQTSKGLRLQAPHLAGCNPAGGILLQLLLERILTSPDDSKEGGGPALTRDCAFLFSPLPSPLFWSEKHHRKKKVLPEKYEVAIIDLNLVISEKATFHQNSFKAACQYNRAYDIAE